jgi:hypothetical protein
VSRADSVLLLALFVLFPCFLGSAAGFPQSNPNATSAKPATSRPWRTPARLHCGQKRTRSGTLSVGAAGVAFAGPATPAARWSFQEIESLDISAHRLVLTTYENRHHHEPGDRRYRFDLQSELSPQLAAEIARWLGKPSRNADPDRATESFAAIPAKHRKPFGGSNGELRFDAGGIEFITAVPGDARAWRWADIQTIANPDPYHFRVAGYLETYEFELKQPMSPQLFDRLWGRLYGQGLNLPESAWEVGHAR